MPRFIACSILCRCSWQYNAALLLPRHSTAKPNSKPLRTFTIDMVSLKFLQHHKHYYSKKYQYLRNCKKRRFCRENLQIRALRKLWGVILRSPKARQLLPPWHIFTSFMFKVIYKFSLSLGQTQTWSTFVLYPTYIQEVQIPVQHNSNEYIKVEQNFCFNGESSMFHVQV